MTGLKAAQGRVLSATLDRPAIGHDTATGMSHRNELPMARIAVIIVNYNAADLAIAAVESVRARHHGGHEVHIHLVDNASPAGDGAAFVRAARDRGWDGQVTLYPERENHGFGRGNNLVLQRLAGGDNPPDFVFLLNPDAQLENEAIAILADFLQARPRAAMAGAQARNPGGAAPVPAAFRFPGAASHFAAALNFGPVARLMRGSRVALGGDLDTRRVDWVSGAAVLARFDVWRDLGFFDPAYFLYYEEVDLMHRAARAGWECWHVAEARIIHVEGASTDVRSARAERVRKPAYWYNSWQHYFRSNHGRIGALGVALAWLAGAGLNLPLARIRGQQPAAPLHFLGDFWALALRPLLGLRPGRPR